MATNNIKIFDQNKANMLTDEAYNTSTQRLNGVQQGIASSQLQNKTLYQVSLVAYAIGQMMQANGLNANDADAVSTFAGNLSNTIVQKILDKADATEAKNFTVNNKFITPQTWKAAYDFMKADSDMVTSAVDDTHYITPKLLKEGANLFGGKVELEDGNLKSVCSIGKLYIQADDKGKFSSYPVKNNKAYLIYASEPKKIYYTNMLTNEVITILDTTDKNRAELKIVFADENYLLIQDRKQEGYLDTDYVLTMYKVASNSFTMLKEKELGYYISNEYQSVTIQPCFTNITGNKLNFAIQYYNRDARQNYRFVANYKFDTNAFDTSINSATPVEINYIGFCMLKEDMTLMFSYCYDKSTNQNVTLYYALITDNTFSNYVYSFSLSSSLEVSYYSQILFYYNNYFYIFLGNTEIAYFQFQNSSGTINHTVLKAISSSSPTIFTLNEDKVVLGYGSDNSGGYIDLSTKDYHEMQEFEYIISLPLKMQIVDFYRGKQDRTAPCSDSTTLYSIYNSQYAFNTGFIKYKIYDFIAAYS